MTTSIKYYTFITDNLPNYVVDMHKEVCKFMEVDVEYHVEKYIEPYDGKSEGWDGPLWPAYRQHGEYMDHVLETSKDDVIGFLDIDCLPYRKVEFHQCADWVKQFKTFLGNAQNISHTQNRNFIYASASHLVVHKDYWKEVKEEIPKMNMKPTMSYRLEKGKPQIDTAQILSIHANQKGTDYQCFLPVGYDWGDPIRMGPYGVYSKGTMYPFTWHLQRISELFNNDELKKIWMERCLDILEERHMAPKYSFTPYRVWGVI